MPELLHGLELSRKRIHDFFVSFVSRKGCDLRFHVLFLFSKKSINGLFNETKRKTMRMKACSPFSDSFKPLNIQFCSIPMDECLEIRYFKPITNTFPRSLLRKRIRVFPTDERLPFWSLRLWTCCTRKQKTQTYLPWCVLSVLFKKFVKKYKMKWIR